MQADYFPWEAQELHDEDEAQMAMQLVCQRLSLGLEMQKVLIQL
jgi:hypothetical protein